MVCYLCGKDKGEIALLGAQGDRIARSMGISDGQMPHRCVVDKTPCDECREHMKLGIIIAEYDPKTQAPTGSKWVVKEEAISGMFDEKGAKDVIKARAMRISPRHAKDMGLYEHFKKEQKP
jgi:hypothetical protein